MAIHVSCRCGATFQVPQQFAGRQAACPKCKAPLVIPDHQTVAPAHPNPPVALPTPPVAAPTPPVAAPLPSPLAMPTASPPAAAPLPPTAQPIDALTQAPQAGPALPQLPSALPASPFHMNTPSAPTATAQPAAGPARRRSSKNSSRNMMIGICVTSVLVIAGCLTVFLLNQGPDGKSLAVASSTEEIAPPEFAQATMVSEQEAQQLVDLINNGLDSRSAQAFGNLIDTKAMCDIALRPYVSDSNTTQMNQAVSGFQTGVSIGITNGMVKEIDAAIFGGQDQFGQPVGGGGGYQFLRFRELDGFRTALFRFQLGGEDGGINYHKLMLSKINGQVRIVDIFVYLTGERMSQTLRRAFVLIASQIDQSVISRFLGGSNTDDFKHIVSMNSAVRAGNFQQILALYNQLPDKLKRDKNMLMSRINAASTLMSFDDLGNVQNEKPYLDALADFRKFHPNDKALPILMIDYHILSNQLKEALASVDILDKSVGGVPYLLILKADTCRLMEDVDQAKQFLEAAKKADPDMPHVYLAMMDIAFIDGDNDAILEGLKKLHDLGVEMDLQALPELREFARTPQFDEYFQYISQ